MYPFSPKQASLVRRMTMNGERSRAHRQRITDDVKRPDSCPGIHKNKKCTMLQSSPTAESLDLRFVGWMINMLCYAFVITTGVEGS